MKASGWYQVMARKEVILLFWDCPYCGHKHIPGPTRRCPGCFWWRDRTVNFYEAPDSVVLSPAEVARYAGPDWICKACGAANPETGEPREQLVCGKCHARQIDFGGGTAPLETLPTGVEVEHRQPQSSSHGNLRQRNPGAPTSPMTRGVVAYSQTNNSSRSWGTPIKLVLVGLCGCCSFGVITAFSWLITRPTVVTAEVLRRHWRVEVPIEEQRPGSEGGWTLPAGAYNVRSEKRQKSTRRVQVGTTREEVRVSYEERVGTREQCTTVSRGDGTGERVCSDEPIYETRYRTETQKVPVYREEPVYATWYTYTIVRWRPLRTAVAEGTEDTPRLPPDVKLATHPYPQRKSSPKQTCFVDAKVQQVRYTWKIACAEYNLVVTEQTQTFWKKPNSDEVTLQPPQ
jgi:hypothetical protein